MKLLTLCAPRFSMVHDKVALRPTVAVTFCNVPLNLGSIFVESVFGVGKFEPETTHLPIGDYRRGDVIVISVVDYLQHKKKKQKQREIGRKEKRRTKE